MPKGGRRAGAGRKKLCITGADRAKAIKSVTGFREYWRAIFESEEGRTWLTERAKTNDYILGKLLDKVYPTPQSMRFEDGAPKIQIVLGSNGRETSIPYVDRILATSKGNGDSTVH